jgi:hypothetical protein
VIQHTRLLARAVRLDQLCAKVSSAEFGGSRAFDTASILCVAPSYLPAEGAFLPFSFLFSFVCEPRLRFFLLLGFLVRSFANILSFLRSFLLSIASSQQLILQDVTNAHTNLITTLFFILFY